MSAALSECPTLAKDPIILAFVQEKVDESLRSVVMDFLSGMDLLLRTVYNCDNRENEVIVFTLANGTPSIQARAVNEDTVAYATYFGHTIAPRLKSLVSGNFIITKYYVPSAPLAIMAMHVSLMNPGVLLSVDNCFEMSSARV